MLGRWRYTLESNMARICREAGGRVHTNLMVRDMDVPAPIAVDSRRLEVYVDGPPVRDGAQVAVYTTLVCALHRDGVPRRGAAERDGVALQIARRKTEKSDGHLVVVAIEVGGRCSDCASAQRTPSDEEARRTSLADERGGMSASLLDFPHSHGVGRQSSRGTRGGRRPPLCRVGSRVWRPAVLPL